MQIEAPLDALALAQTQAALVTKAMSKQHISFGLDYSHMDDDIAHVTSKLRFQSAQVAAYLADGLWLRLAAHANERMRELMTELESLATYGVRSQERVDVNMAFVEMPGPALDAAAEAGVLFYRMAPDVARLVTSWQTTPDEVLDAGAIFREAVEAASN